MEGLASLRHVSTWAPQGSFFVLMVYCCLTALSAQTGYIVPQKYNVYHIGQGNNTAIQLNSETIE